MIGGINSPDPDAQMVRGVPREFIDMANKRLAAINVAREEVTKERGL